MAVGCVIIMTSIGRGWVPAEMQPLKSSLGLRPARHSDRRGCVKSSDLTDLTDYHKHTVPAAWDGRVKTW